MSDRPVEDRLCDKIDQIVFEHLADSLDVRCGQFAIDGMKPQLQFTRDPNVYPLFVDLGEERLAIEVDVSVWKIVKGSRQDTTCSESEAYPPREASK